MFFELVESVFLVLKILLLSAVYTTVIFLILFVVSNKTKGRWLKNRMEHKIANWLLLYFLISLGLYNFSYSYWENTGLGESPQLPIGYGQVIYSPDFTWTEFYPDLNKRQLNKDGLQIDSFIVKDDMLCATVSHQNTNSPTFDFIVCDLRLRTNKTFNSEQEYNDFAIKNNLPFKSEFYDFRKHYQDYFANKPAWRKWLSPR